jgi:hypothetical protein
LLTVAYRGTIFGDRAFVTAPPVSLALGFWSKYGGIQRDLRRADEPYSHPAATPSGDFAVAR